VGWSQGNIVWWSIDHGGGGAGSGGNVEMVVESFIKQKADGSCYMLIAPQSFVEQEEAA